MDEIALLQGLVAIPSPSGQEAEAVTWLVDRMESLGLNAHVDEVGNAVGTVGTGPRQIMLLGHIDTVPGGPHPKIRDGRLYGRGAVDAKGPLAAFVMAVAGLAPAEGWQFVVVGAVEEEAATSRGARHVAQTYRPDFCIVGEPSGWDAITLGYKGRLLLDYECRQPTAHTAGPARAVAEHAVSYWNAVVAYAERFNQGRQGTFHRLQPSLRHIETCREGDEDVVRATFAFRLPPGLSPTTLRRDLQALNPNGGCLSFRGAEPAFVADRRTPLTRAFLHAIRRAGGTPRFKVKTGTSDMNVVGPAWQCPIVAYGPGDSRLDHTPDEYIELDEYRRGIAVLRAALEHLIAGELSRPAPAAARCGEGA
ncbi:MAG: [LysW]-lysine hydrolase [Ardenticatenia bacterium]|nr:[LysW]-lysine hydrolase [Ardenticatenia bacterium]